MADLAPINLKVPKALKDRATSEARAFGVSLSDYVRAAMAESIRRGAGADERRPSDPAAALRRAFGPGHRVTTSAVGDVLPERDRDSAVEALAELEDALAALAGGRDLAGLYGSLGGEEKEKAEAWHSQFRALYHPDEDVPGVAVLLRGTTTTTLLGGASLPLDAVSALRRPERMETGARLDVRPYELLRLAEALRAVQSGEPHLPSERIERGVRRCVEDAWVEAGLHREHGFDAEAAAEFARPARFAELVRAHAGRDPGGRPMRPGEGAPLPTRPDKTRQEMLRRWTELSVSIALGGGPEDDDDLAMFCERARRGLTFEDGRFETRSAEPAGYALALAPAGGARALNAELRMPPADSPPRRAGGNWTTRFEFRAALRAHLAAGAEHSATVVADGATVERFGCRVVSWGGAQGRLASLVVVRTPSG